VAANEKKKYLIGLDEGVHPPVLDIEAARMGGQLYVSMGDEEPI
jgi:hypothetical protein